ncbi:MAG: hypothetical protein LC640_09925 [Frankia sp.]|nr:hypothetical protein [Frankia sp.]
MPCYRCDARQTDPVRGASPWKRGVIAGAQVLVCPDCQQNHDWLADLDRCARCGSTNLVRALGASQCRRCGHRAETDGDARSADESGVTTEGLTAEVSAALDRVFRRGD